MALIILTASALAAAGVRERLVPPAASTQPHIVMVLVDDFGWAEVGWHRNRTFGDVHVPATDEVRTPRMDKLVLEEGIELTRHYVFKCCSPTRSAVQSGRNPYHVNPLNAAMEIHNEKVDPISGFAGVPRNMTGMATKLAAAGYATRFYGKWDAGMATAEHSPPARGYQAGMWYWHHQNDYWSMIYPLSCPNNATPPDGMTMALSDAPAPRAGSAAFAPRRNTVRTAGFGRLPMGLATATSKLAGKATHSLTDLWHKTDDVADGAAAFSYGSPARGYNNTCHSNNPDGGEPAECSAGPLNTKDWFGGYEDALLEEQVLLAVNSHDHSAQPLFLFWAPHIVHAPLQVPDVIAAEFEFIESSAAGDNAKHSRQRYHAMVSFLDAAIGNVTDAIKAKTGMWENTVMVLFGDNGGWMSANGTAGGNNYPLTGGKYNNWEGGIRLNAFLSGGFLPKASRGTQHHGLVAGWDWYATWCALAGVDPTDHRAAAAGLPPIDSHDISELILGKLPLSAPRRELPIGDGPSLSNISSAPLCSSYDQGTLASQYDLEYSGDERWWEHREGELGFPRGANCSTVTSLIVDDGAGMLWKLVTGDEKQYIGTGPQYPNASTNFESQDPQFTKHCGNGCLFELNADPLERSDVAARNPKVLASLYAKLVEYERSAFNPHRGSDDGLACFISDTIHRGFWGPFVGDVGPTL